MCHRLVSLAATLVLAGSVGAQTLTVQVEQETSVNSDSYALLGTIQGYTTTGTVADFYAYDGQKYTGTTPGVRCPCRRWRSTRSSSIGSDGVGFITIHGPRKGAPITVTSRHDIIGGGAFVSPLAVMDDADDTFTFAGSNTQLEAATSTANKTTDGFAVRFSGTTAPVIQSQLVASSNGSPLWRVHSASGLALNLAAVAGRRVRFTLSYDLVPAAIPTPQDAPGWRLLSVPFGGLDVLDLAELNLVLGVPAGATNAAQYPDAGGSNLYHKYEGVTTVDGSPSYLYTPVPTPITRRGGKGHLVVLVRSGPGPRHFARRWDREELRPLRPGLLPQRCWLSPALGCLRHVPARNRFLSRAIAELLLHGRQPLRLALQRRRHLRDEWDRAGHRLRLGPDGQWRCGQPRASGALGRS